MVEKVPQIILELSREHQTLPWLSQRAKIGLVPLCEARNSPSALTKSNQRYLLEREVILILECDKQPD
jgi:hypothetical protein